MSRLSPTAEGFRAAFRLPSVTLAEIAWRWTLGAVAAALLVFGFIEFLDTLPVTPADATLLRTKHPVLVGRAIAHILRGSLTRAVLAALLVVLALSVLWIITASIGRFATVRALLDYFHTKFHADVSPDTPHHSESFRLLIPLHFLRVAVVLAALLAFAGAAILAGFASSAANPRPALVVILFLPLAGLILLAWSALSWLLSLAGIFAVRDADDTLAALSAAITFSRERAGPISGVSTWAGLAHLVALSVAASALSVPFVFLQIAPARLILVLIALVALAYFAVVDWLYIARLAGYACIAAMPQALASSTPVPLPPYQLAPAQTIDRDEPILSDLSNLAIET